MNIEGLKNNDDKGNEPKFPQIATEIEQMVVIDQEMREKSLNDDAAWDEEVDRRNTESMKRIVSEIGWPTVSKVGKQASSAWLLVQHSDHDPEFQEQCLALMKKESENNVSTADIAYLEDRVRVNRKQGQVYGTQFHEIRDASGNAIRFEPRSIEDAEHLNQRRAKMGLEPHEEYTRRLTEKYFPHLLNRE
ncbi:MAG: hypothetical protein UX66_C0006G0005 [Parcubacteria group bacterium GW2011_GWF2_46_8]|nr:MAG: hypothetical protein UX14_C0005G0013 [Parcubacteria group bacterium GW2011_GWF1_45_5]KKU47741.1 MAG: hypothetical protein UX66_C0006G0005 [Parcubacteria group bacterium GW2011_GWF2_46_8]